MICGAEKDFYTCTRPEGHDGEHRDGDDPCSPRWGQAPGSPVRIPDDLPEGNLRRLYRECRGRAWDRECLAREHEAEQRREREKRAQAIGLAIGWLLFGG